MHLVTTAHLGRRVLAVLLGFGLTLAVTDACAAEPLPAPIVRSFLLAWQSGNFHAAALRTTGAPGKVAPALRKTERQLNAASMQFQLAALRQHGQTAVAHFLASVDLGNNGSPWQYRGRLRLTRSSGTWRIMWSPSVIHPRLRAGQRLALVTHVPSRAVIQDHDGHSLVKQTPVAVVGVYPAHLTDPAHTAHSLAALTGLDPARVLGRIHSAPPNEFTPLVTLRSGTYQRIRGRLRAVDGLHFRLGSQPYTPLYANRLLGAVGTATKATLRKVGEPYNAGDSIGLTGLQIVYQRKLAGVETTQVVTLDHAGHVAKVLRTWKGMPGSPVVTTIDKSVQRAAELAVAGDKPVSLVAVDARTGQIRAAAERPINARSSLDHGYSPGPALTGKYPPGSAFTPISTDALLNTGLGVRSKIPCPAQRTVGGMTFSSSQAGYGYQAPSFAHSFVDRCDTAFVGLSRRLPDGGLNRSATRFGIGSPWQLPVDGYSGTVPNATGEGARAAQTLGSGGVKVSPLGMAMMAGAIDSGSWRPPQLVLDPKPSGRKIHARAVPAKHLGALRYLTRASVRFGDARAVDVPGKAVHGQPGIAAYRRHVAAWFVGYSGNLAFAVLVRTHHHESNAALPVAATFLRHLPGQATK